MISWLPHIGLCDHSKVNIIKIVIRWCTWLHSVVAQCVTVVEVYPMRWPNL